MLLIIVTLILVLPGCSEQKSNSGAGADRSLRGSAIDDDSVGDQRSSDTSLTTEADGVMSLPLDAYIASGDATDALNAASEQLIADCMTAQGFDYQPVGPSKEPERPLGITDEAYGISEFSDAERYGYLGEDWSARVESLQQGPSAREEYSPSYLEALTGGVDPMDSGGEPGGCMGKAAEALNANESESADVFRIVGEIGVDAAARTRADDRILAAFARWSECMKDAGYSYDVPSQPPKDFPVTIDINNLETIPPPTPSEVATALADQACKRSVHLFDTWVEVESEYQREGIDRNQAALAEYADAIKARIETARSIVERSSSGRGD